MEKAFVQLSKIFLCLFIFISASAFAQTDDTVLLLTKLTNLPGASGSESSIRKFIEPIWKRKLKVVKKDGIGNLIGQFKHGSSQPNILLMAHMDELGFLIRDITPNGFLKVEPLGGWASDDVFAERWVIQTKKGEVYGYSGNESGHIIPRQNQSSHAMAADKTIPVRDLVIDVGASSRDDAENRLGLRPGLSITPASNFTILNNSKRYLGKAFDDRAGLAVLTEIIEHSNQLKHPNNIYAAATVQEEVGLRGAKVVGNQTKPDIAINIEICIAGDHPLIRTPKDITYPALGKGPCLYVYERSMLPNNALMDFIIDVAKKENIPYQFASAPNYGQDGAVVQQSGNGVPAINIGIPLRYAHQQAGVIDRDDYDATIKLITAILKKLDGKQVQLIKNS